MDMTASHLGYVVASYGLSAIFLLGLTIHIVLKDRRLRAEAERLDSQRRKTGT